MKKLILIISGSILLSCNQEIKNSLESSAIQAPLENVHVKNETFSIDPTKDEKIITKDGTIISIPSNSLVDKQGNLVKEKVNLSFTPIHKPEEIIAAGIPMTYDSIGKKFDFVSAGMFTIQAFLANEEVQIAKGKEVNIELASFKTGNEFSFYKIDEQNGKWDYLGKNEPKPNQEKKKKLKIFDDENFLNFDIDYSSRPELRPFKDIKWRCLSSDNRPNPLKNEWMLKEFWYDIDLKMVDKKESTYEITLSNETKVHSFYVSPYVNDEHTLDKLNLSFENMNEEIKKLKEEKEAIQLQADILRSFPISSFGTYNWDTIEKRIQEGVFAMTNAQFKLDGKAINEVCNVYFISEQDKILSRKVNKWDKLVFNPNDTSNKLIMIKNDQTVGVCDANEFKKAKNIGEYTFNLKKIKNKINSIEDLKELIKS